jgi:hypothetical protein
VAGPLQLQEGVDVVVPVLVVFGSRCKATVTFSGGNMGLRQARCQHAVSPRTLPVCLLMSVLGRFCMAGQLPLLQLLLLLLLLDSAAAAVLLCCCCGCHCDVEATPRQAAHHQPDQGLKQQRHTHTILQAYRTWQAQSTCWSPNRSPACPSNGFLYRGDHRTAR